ncbi:MAG: HAD family hydrolase [Arcobacter sp.]|uniref:HAD family hydrolase n=1 Tax=Arcobacter sp. TaxID=1872629 RepID=UPI003C723874
MKLIMFDMDGTLINSGGMIANTINHVRENLGLEALEKKYILEKVNDPGVNSAEFFYGTKNFTQEQGKLFETYYYEHCLTDLEIYDGIKELLEDLKSDYIFTVATNANSEFANRMLNHLEIGKYFKTVVGYNDVLKPKPHPEMVYKILEEIKTTKEKSLLVGDSHKDIQAAANAGIESVLVNWGFSDHEENAIENVKELEERIFKKFR